MTRNELIAHPIRLRILGVLAGRELTAEQIGLILDDVPPATLYRHLSLLLGGGQVVVVREVRQRGRTTRILGLVDGAGMLDRDEVDVTSTEANADYVNTFLTRHMAGYASAIRDPNVLPGDWSLLDQVLYLSEAEERALRAEMLAAIERHTTNSREDRRRRAVILGFLPDRDLPQEKP